MKISPKILSSQVRNEIKQLTNQGKHLEASKLYAQQTQQVSQEPVSKLGQALQEMVQELKERFPKK